MNKVIPIIDTDIWVFLVLTDYHKRVMKRFGQFIFSDIVEKEILKWETNSGDSRKVAQVFSDYKDNNKITVIKINDFTDEEQLVINHQLAEYDLQQVSIMEKNKGEFVSLLYALHKKIKRFKTNDRKFASEIEGGIKDKIEIVNWDDILENYSISIKEQSHIRELLENRERKMKTSNSVPADPRWEKLKALTNL